MTEQRIASLPNSCGANSVSAVKDRLNSGDDVTTLCRTYAHYDVRLLRDLKAAVLTGVRAFLGSVSNHVVQHAHRPVLVIPHASEQAAKPSTAAASDASADEARS